MNAMNKQTPRTKNLDKTIKPKFSVKVKRINSDEDRLKNSNISSKDLEIPQLTPVFNTPKTMSPARPKGLLGLDITRKTQDKLGENGEEKEIKPNKCMLKCKHIFFCQFNYLFKKGDIEETDLKDLPDDVKSEAILKQFDEIYDDLYRKKKKLEDKNKPAEQKKRTWVGSRNSIDVDLDSSINPLNQSVDVPPRSKTAGGIPSLGGNINMGSRNITDSMIFTNPGSKQKIINEKRIDTKIMMNAIFKIIYPNLWKAIVYSIISNVLKIALPFTMKTFLDLITENQPIGKLILWVILATVLAFFDGLVTEHSIFETCGCKARTGQILRTVFFRKIERANYSFLKVTDNSFINKMVLFELEHIVQFVGELPKLFTSPITLILALFYIYQELKSLVVVVFGVFIVCVVLLNLLKRRSVIRLRKYFALESKKSTRISECIPNMQSVKLNGLEKFFASKLSKIRAKEGSNLMKLHIYDAFSDAIFEGTPLFCSIMIIGIMAVVQGEVEAASAFSAITVLELLSDPLDALANSFDRIEAYSSAKRSFRLFLEEVPERIISIQPDNFPVGKIEIKDCDFDFVAEKQMANIIDQMMGEELARAKEFKLRSQKLKKIKTLGAERVTRQLTKQLVFSGSFRSKSLKSTGGLKSMKTFNNAGSDGKTHQVTKYVTMLHNINVVIQPGQKVCLVGKPGSGFSEFLLSLVSESKISNEGIMNIKGGISYLNVRMSNFVIGTVKSNIILEGKYDPERFKMIIAKLKINLNRLKGEEYFEILEGAKNISIDLQRKILLARWVYQEKDIYLMDDLFDDLNVAEWNMIYQNIIMDVLKEKTVIFMSYTNLQIKVADHIILFDNGQIIEQGSYHDLLSDASSELRKVVLQDNGEGGISLLGRLMEGQKKTTKLGRSKVVFLKNNPFEALAKAQNAAKTLKSRLPSKAIADGNPLAGGMLSNLLNKKRKDFGPKKSILKIQPKAALGVKKPPVNPLGLPLPINSKSNSSDSESSKQKNTARESRKRKKSSHRRKSKDTLGVSQISKSSLDRTKSSRLHASDLSSDISSGDSGMEMAPIKSWDPGNPSLNNLPAFNENENDKNDPLKSPFDSPMVSPSIRKKKSVKNQVSNFMKISIGNEDEESLPTTQKKQKEIGSTPFGGLFAGFTKKNSNADSIKKGDEPPEALNEVMKRFDFVSDLNKKSMKSYGKMIAAESLDYKQAKDYLMKYFFLRGKFPVILILLLFLMSSIFTVSYDVWIGFWSQDAFSKGAMFYFWCYLALSIVGTIYLVVRDIIYDHIMYHSSNMINNIVLDIVLRLRMSWFDHQPVDRVMYRLTKDQSQLDILIPKLILKTIESCMMVIVGFLILNYVYYGLIIFVSLIYICIITTMFKKFLRVTLKMTHFISIKKSEVVSLMSQNLAVCMLLRSTGNINFLKRRFIRQNDSFQQCTTHVTNFLQRWIGMRLTYIGTSLVLSGFAYPIMASFARDFFFQAVWKIAFSMAWSFKTVKYLKRFIRSVSLVFSNMISISRLYEYVETVDDVETNFEEAEKKKQKVKLKEDHEGKKKNKYTGITNQIVPVDNSRRKTISTNDTGSPRSSVFSQYSKSYRNPITLLRKYKFNSISLKNVSLSLSGQKTVLKNITMKINRSETIGLYGRTMSGIPHLLPLMCGLYDRERVIKEKYVPTTAQGGLNLSAFANPGDKKAKGKPIDSFINISNISIDKINPKNWRKSFMYLAEEPLIIAGTVRDNIDPYHAFDDDIIIKTLEFIKFNDLIGLDDKLVQKKLKISELELNQDNTNPFGLAEIKEVDEFEVNNSDHGEGKVKVMIRDKKMKDSPNIRGSKFGGASNMIHGKLKENKLNNDDFWDLNAKGDDEEEEKELESAINIGSEAGNLTITKMHTKYTDNMTKYSKTQNRRSTDNFDMSNNLGDTKNRKDINNESNGSWADLLRENEKEVEKELKSSKLKSGTDKIMSAIDVRERKNTDANEETPYRKELLAPAINLDRRESSSEKPVPSNVVIPGLHPDLLLNKPPPNANKTQNKQKQARFSLRIPMASKRFDSPSLDPDLDSEKNKMFSTSGFKKNGQSAFSKPNGFRGILESNESESGDKDHNNLKDMVIDSPPVKPRNTQDFMISEASEDDSQTSHDQNLHVLQRKRRKSSKSRKSWINTISKYVTDKKPFIKKVEKINANDPEFKFTHPENMYEFDDVNLIDRSNIHKLEMSSAHKENIEDFLEYRVSPKAGNLTIGLKKMIMIARVFLEEPPFIILDENSIDFDELDNSFFFRVFKVSTPNSEPY